MGATLDTTTLCRHWVRAREEDTESEMVYRPVDYALPPARGRSGLVFDAAGTFKRIGIGQTDVSVVTQGIWQVVDAGAGQIRIEIGNSSEDLTVVTREDRLAIRKN